MILYRFLGFASNITALNTAKAHTPACLLLQTCRLWICHSVCFDILWLHLYLWTISLKKHTQTHTSLVTMSIHHTYYTISPVFFFQHSIYLITHHRLFLFIPEEQTRRYSCYHTHAAFIDTTDITARGVFASVQTANHLLRAPMKSCQSGQRLRSGVRRGALPCQHLIFPA